MDILKLFGLGAFIFVFGIFVSGCTSNQEIVKNPIGNGSQSFTKSPLTPDGPTVLPTAINTLGIHGIEGTWYIVRNNTLTSEYFIFKPDGSVAYTEDIVCLSPKDIQKLLDDEIPQDANFHNNCSFQNCQITSPLTWGKLSNNIYWYSYSFSGEAACKNNSTVIHQFEGKSYVADKRYTRLEGTRRILLTYNETTGALVGEGLVLIQK